MRRGWRPALTATLLLLLVLAAVVLPMLPIAPGLVAAINAGMRLGHPALLSRAGRSAGLAGELPLVGGSAGRAGRRWRRRAATSAVCVARPTSRGVQAVLLDVAAGWQTAACRCCSHWWSATMFWTTGELIADGLRHAARRIGGPTGVDALRGGRRRGARGRLWRRRHLGRAGRPRRRSATPWPACRRRAARLPAASRLDQPDPRAARGDAVGAAAVVAVQPGRTGLGDVHGAVGRHLVRQRQPAAAAADQAWRRRCRSPSIIIGVFGGFVAFGFLGLFIGPVLLAVGLVMLRAWRAERTPA